MSNIQKKESVQSLLSSENVKNRLNEILGKRSSTFATSVLQIVKSNAMLANAEPSSVVGAAMTAATINLPLNNNLGFAYIIPFNEKQKDGSYLVKAQFQISYRGFIQLAMRSNQFKTINVSEVVEGEIASQDRLSGEIEFNWIQDDKERLKKKTVGYVAYFRLVNGFEKSMYMSSDELNAHGKKFSQTFKKNFGLWKTDFDAMAKKTVLKLLLSKYAPMDIEGMDKAVITDQATFNSADDINDINYPDNEEPKHDPDSERIRMFIESAESQDDLDFAKGQAGEEHLELIKAKQKELNLKAKKQ